MALSYLLNIPKRDLAVKLLETLQKTSWAQGLRNLGGQEEGSREGKREEEGREAGRQGGRDGGGQQKGGWMDVGSKMREVCGRE